MKWEYLITYEPLIEEVESSFPRYDEWGARIDRPTYSKVIIDPQFSDRGRVDQSWELVSVVPHNNKMFYYWKRPIA